MQKGKFIISLDFELQWGVRDKMSLDQYGKNIEGVQTVIPQLLSLFEQYEIAATFSTVGFLYFNNTEHLQNNFPLDKPTYTNTNLSPYTIDFTEINDSQNKFYFAPNIIQQIQQSKYQEIGTHTFCHYYCLEPGQNIQQFKADIQSAIAIAKQHNIETTSLVFPRNQFNNEYLELCASLGIICYRGNEKSWIYEARNGETESSFRRAVRLIDAYLNLSGYHTYDIEKLKNNTIVNIPSSRFLRPYISKLKLLDSLRLKRILNAMTHAAKNNEMYHLWWHPHNFGVNQVENFQFLQKILEHYKKLNSTYGFQSNTMSQFAKSIM